jgi:signal transduction histidine kinase
MSLARPRSLRTSISLVAVAVLAGWVLLIAVGVNLVVAKQLSDEAGDLLRLVAQEAAGTVEIGPTGVITVRETSDEAALDVGTWFFHGSELVEGPPDSTSLDAHAAQLVDRGATFDQTGGPDGVRWYAEPVMVGQQQVGTVVTALSLAPYRSTGQYTLAGTVVLSVLLLAGAFLVLRAGVGRALRPVGEMTDQAARWSTDEVERRFGDRPLPAELDKLAGTLDGLLDRLSAVLRNERQLSAEISHELRTPLARASAEIQLLRRQSEQSPESAAALARSEDSLRELADILETLMSTAHRPGVTAVGRCDATAVLGALVDRRKGLPPNVVLLSGEPAMAGVDGAVLERALSPIIDNAQRYATSMVQVEVTAQRGSVRIQIRDDGPGIPDADLPYIFDPGYQGQLPDGHQGSGLGLALAHRLITGADGTITAGGDGGGAVLTVTVPAA